MAPSPEALARSLAALERGRVHYVCGRYFQAHEDWEAAWRVESGPMRRLLQGLIMAAAAYHKMAAQQHAVGMSILLERALEQLRPLPGGFAGLELDRFRAGLERSLDEARAWRVGAPPPAGPAPLGAALSTGDVASQPRA